MALPTLVKTWQYTINQAFGGLGSGTDAKNLIRLIKNALIGFGTLPWAVRYSCDGTTAGTAGDLVDRWSADSKVVITNSPSSAHSWMVLRQTGLGGGSGCEILLDFGTSNTNGSLMRFAVSPAAGFTGGTTTASPTATDEYWIGGSTGTDFTWCTNGAMNGKFHVWQSTDGQCTRVMVTVGGVIVSVWVIDKPAGTPTNWSNPVAALVYSNGASESSTYALLFRTTARFNALMGTGPTFGQLFPTCEAVNQVEVGSQQTYANDQDSNYPILPIGLFCTTGTGIRGRQGTFVDLWCGSTGVASGSTYPNDATRLFAQFGILVLPWGGSATPQIS